MISRPNPDPAPPRTALYARYSSENQRDASIEDQLRVCQTRADREGWNVVSTFADHATSGATTLRSGYQALLAALRGGDIDIVLAESLDRFSRDLEHIASFHKQCVFHDVVIHTLAEGAISELHIGLKGTMGAIYLKDLAEKTKRGLEGRINAGRCTGSPAYGYMVVRKMGENGELDRGLRAIDPDRAAVVRRIFESYATGSSPRRIARALNAEGVPGPGGSGWYDASILGRAKRGDGLLRNELYVGRLIWRRRVNAKDPMSGKKLRRDAQPNTYLTQSVPHLRIIEDALWGSVQARLQREAAPLPASGHISGPAFWHCRRPRHLLTGKLICGHCGRVFISTGKDYLGCRAALHGSCRNRRTIRRGWIEGHVLELLSRQLMRPDLVVEFVAAFNAELSSWNAEAKARASSRQRDAASLDRKIANLVDAISDGGSSPAILAKLAEFEARRDELGAQESEVVSPAPALHPGIAETYESNIRALKASLEAGDEPEMLEAARLLIDKVIVHPPETDDKPPGIELVGDLTALLEAAGVGETQALANTQKPASVLATFVSSVKAGPGAEPRPSFFLTYPSQ